MPAIYLFDRKSMLGGDDLQIPCLLAMVLRFVQLGPFLVHIWAHLMEEAHGNILDYLWYDPDDFDCRQSHFFPLLVFIYCLSSTLIVVVSLLWEIRLYWWSGVGSPTERQPRSRRVQSLLEFRLVPMGIILFLVLLLGVSAVPFAPQYYGCQSNMAFWQSVRSLADDDNDVAPRPVQHHWWWISYILLWCTQLGEVLAILLFVRQLLSTTADHPAVPHEHAEAVWADRCTSFCRCLGVATCFAFGGRDIERSNYEDVARALADYFEYGQIFNLVPSDIVMGMMVLQKVQRQRVLEARHAVVTMQKREASIVTESSSHSLLLSPRTSRQSVYIAHHEGHNTFYESTSRKVLSRTNPVDRVALEEGARFARYQLAIYSVLLYLYQHPITGLPKLLFKSSCCNGQYREDYSDEEESISSLALGTTVIGDNCCHVHTASLLLQAGLVDSPGDLIYAQLRSSFSEIPYCILVDHAWKSVVLAIRGTFSIEDCVTDVMLDPEPLESLGTEYGFDARDQYCHAGIYRCARVIARDLEQHHILDGLLLGNMARYPGYTLRVVGHSLGGATAALLSYMLRRKFPTLRCLSYSPPGYSFSWKLATECRDWCTTFVVDSDLVPRLTLDSMDHLRDELLELIGRIQVPKFEVARRILRGSPSFWSCRDQGLEDEGDILDRVIDGILSCGVPSAEYSDQLAQFRSVQNERRSSRGLLRSVKLFPPGKMVHFMKTGEKRSCVLGLAKCLTCCTTNHGAQYTPVYIQNDDLCEIVVSPTMGTDHFPDRICSVMERMANDFYEEIKADPTDLV